MAEIIVYSDIAISNIDEISTNILYDDDFTLIIKTLFKKGNQEFDTNHVTLIILSDKLIGKSPLNQLPNEDKHLLLKYYFNHLNLLIINEKDLQQTENIGRLKFTIQEISKYISDRITRVETWTGCGKSCVDDQFGDISNQINEMIGTMSYTIDCVINKSKSTTDKLKTIKDMIIAEINFKELLSNNNTSHLSKLCNLVGHWSFPAHELTNDDLSYCVYLIIKYALDQINDETINLSPNELMGMIFMVRDTYKNGNPFHNFRHAVDVLQACFHYVIRLGYLPSFTQFQTDPKADELICLYSEKFGNAVELIPMTKLSKTRDETNLNLYQTLALLLAALGHDVGHPGVTNAFMIKHSTPTSLLYNERSVLELFHSSIFINKILIINWPHLLNLMTDSKTKLTFKDLIITSILATDMAEHFEYVDKLTHFSNNSSKLVNRIKLISSLLIKCADISNVTRPLRVSAQWTSVLGREFDEVNELENKIIKSTFTKDIKYDKIPIELSDILKFNPNLHKGQIFFINTFAENLFNNIVELLPQLKFTGDIVKENKEFWLKRDNI